MGHPSGDGSLDGESARVNQIFKSEFLSDTDISQTWNLSQVAQVTHV